MKKPSIRLKTLLVSGAIFLTIYSVQAQQTATSTVVPVKMTVTASVASGKRMPEIKRQDVVVKAGSERLEVTQWAPARGDRAGLDLFILIDDTSNATSLGSQLEDLRAFINAQASTTSIGVGYMSNTTVRVVQDLTTDHAQAAKALRLPMESAGAFGSPYLSLIDIMKRWPEHANRREVLMVTDGIDRARGGPRFRLGTNPDVNSAIDVAQRTGTVIHTIYTPGVGRLARNFWEVTRGQNGIAQLSEETGGESFYLRIQAPVSFKPYFDQLQDILDNQYLLVFSAKPGSKAGLQYVNVDTEVAGVELGAADAVWVPSAK